MTLKQIARLGKELVNFLALFGGCFRSRPGFALLQVYVKGLVSNVQRKNIEAIALDFGQDGCTKIKDLRRRNLAQCEKWRCPTSALSQLKRRVVKFVCLEKTRAKRRWEPDN